MVKITGKTTIYGVIGNPVSHTASPYFQNIFLKEAGLDSIYVPFHINDEMKLENVVKGLFSAGIRGLNVTIPFKEKLLNILDTIEPSAFIIGAVNTICLSPDGKLMGFNTDHEGFANDFKACTGCDIKGHAFLCLGAGGSARSVVYKLADMDARKIYILNRTFDNAVKLSENINRFKGFDIVTPVKEIRHWKELTDGIPEFIINTTPAGMATHSGSSDIEGLWPEPVRGQTLYDLIYLPPVTPFMRKALDKGLEAYNGLGMLVHQGACSFKLWTGLDVKEDLIMKVINDMKVMYDA